MTFPGQAFTKALLLMGLLTLAGGSQAAPADQTFVQKAAKDNLAEVQMGQMAVDKAANPQVKAYAAQMVADHKKANADLKQIAQSAGIPVPDQADEQHQAKARQLSQLSGTEFDRHYMQMQVKDHQKAIELFRSAAESAELAALETYAEQQVPILESHLQHARDLSGQLQQDGGNR